MTSRLALARAFRITALVLPSWLAWGVAFSMRKNSELVSIVVFGLGPLAALLVAALALRAESAWSRGGSERARRSVLAELDVLTGSGAALAWLSAIAILGAVWLGFASLATIGLLGTGVFHIVVLHALFALRGADPIHIASISRRFSPGEVTEGDDVIEEVHVAAARIPIGFRLFISGRIGPRWPTSRHVVESPSSGAHVLLESHVGPALRGDHAAEPLEVWLEDVFGISRGRSVATGDARLTVLPRLRSLDRPVSLQGRGIGPRTPRAVSRLPSEGLFNLREYQPGDDVRRIHWVRSAAAGELIVRLPDELPPDRPHVRLVLDTFFPEATALACDQPSELLDAVVAVWLGLGRALAEFGARVTLVTVLPRAATAAHDLATKTQELSLRDPAAGQRLGAQVSWQGRITVDALLTDEITYVVSRGILTRPPETDKVRWILVPPATAPDVPWTIPSATQMPHPMGSSDNRWSRRKRRIAELVQERADRMNAIVAMRTNVALPPPGRSFVAIPLADGTIQLEAIS